MSARVKILTRTTLPRGEDDRVGDKLSRDEQTCGLLPLRARGFGAPRSKQTPVYSRAASFFHTLASGASLVRRVRWS